MKKQIRILGVDDAPFMFQDSKTMIIGVVMRGGEYLECVLKDEITIDGDDATDTCIDMIKKTRYHKQLKTVMLNGVTLGGFNIVDINMVYKETGVPVITITRDKPDLESIRKALLKHFKDWRERYNLIVKGRMHKVPTLHNPIYIKYIGVTLEEAKEIIKLSTIRGTLPEPIRIAHLIASGVKRGESYGKA